MKVHQSKGYYCPFQFTYAPKESNESKTNESLWITRLLYLFASILFKVWGFLMCFMEQLVQLYN